MIPTVTLLSNFSPVLPSYNVTFPVLGNPCFSR
jgi:hypothetical protein